MRGACRHRPAVGIAGQPCLESPGASFDFARGNWGLPGTTPGPLGTDGSGTCTVTLWGAAASACWGTALGSPQTGIPLSLPRAPLLQVEGREWEKLVLQAA